MSLPRYPEYKTSGIDWLDVVPAHWQELALSRVLKTPVTDGPHLTPTFCDDGIPFLSVDGIQDGELVFEGCRYISHDDHAEFSRKASPRANDILMGKAASIGKIARVKTDTEFSIWSPLALIRVSEDACLPAFAEYVLKSPGVQAQVTTLANSNTQLNIGMKDIPKLRFGLPPLREQAAIAAFLDRETAKIDALIAEQEKLIALLAEKRQATISHAVTRGLNPHAPMKDSGVAWLGEVPAHWEMKRVKDCGCEIVDCKNRTPEPHDDGDYFVVRTSCVKDGQFNPEPGYWTDEANFTEWTAKGLPKAGDVLFTREAPTGEACLAPEDIDFCLGQRMMYIRPPKQVLLSEFLLYSIYGGLARERISEKSKGSTVGHLRVGEVGELRLLLPPLGEQKALVDFVSKALSKLQLLAVESERAIALLKERRSALIAAAVTGQIDVRSAAPI